MSRFRAVSHVELHGRRVRGSATFSFTMSVDVESPAEVPAPRKRAVSGWVPAGLQDPTVRWDVLPARIRPDEWTTGQADDAVPGSILSPRSSGGPRGSARPDDRRRPVP